MWPPNTLFSINFVLGQDSPGPHMYKEWSDGGGDEGRKSSQEDSMSEEEMDEVWRSAEMDRGARKGLEMNGEVDSDGKR